MSGLLRPEILSLGEYSLARHPCRIKLNQNENPYELPDPIKHEILSKLAGARWSRYPAFVPERQIELLAASTGWRADGILTGNGSNELLQVLFNAVLCPGRSVVINQPTFTLYSLLARAAGANVHDVFLRRPFSFDIDRLIDVGRTTKASMIVLCSPNNPTGTVIDRAGVERLLASTDALVVLDEAYVQFAPESCLALLATTDRLVVLRTFSKAMGAAGLRFGYALCSPEIARQVAKIKLPYNVNIFTLIGVEVLLERRDVMKSWLDAIISERSRVREALEHFSGITVHPSGANFLFVETDVKTPGEVFNGLLQRGILVRDVSSYPTLERGLRITVGTPEENTAFLGALKEVL